MIVTLFVTFALIADQTAYFSEYATGRWHLGRLVGPAFVTEA